MRCFLALAVSAFSWTGCVDTSVDRVLLDARVESVEIEVEQTALVTVLRGTFDLVLELGDLAEQPSTVSDAPSFTLVQSEDQAFVRVLDGVPSGSGFPVTVQPGTTESISLTLSDENTLGADQFDVICAAGALQVVGLVKDDANGDESTSFASSSFSPGGCE
jgi:hypothetical protein